ncbi:MAG: 3'-5' exonuclease [Polyangiaceae bacterium]
MPRRPPPPEGAPWDLPIAEAPFAFVDLEMTGLDAKQDRVVEVCIERVRGDVVESRVSTLVKPPERAGGAAHVHGLDEAALADAPPFTELAESLRTTLDGAIFVAHAAEWDIRFLAAEFGRVGVTFAPTHWLDTLVLARRAFLQRSYSLDALAVGLEFDRGHAHRADGDVLAMRRLFAKCLELLAPTSPRDLWEVRVAERKARAAILEACEAARRESRPVELTYRPSKKPAETMTLVVQGVLSELDPPKVLGYQLPGRGRRELRADRILRVDGIPPSDAGERPPESPPKTRDP